MEELADFLQQHVLHLFFDQMLTPDQNSILAVGCISVGMFSIRQGCFFHSLQLAGDTHQMQQEMIAVCMCLCMYVGTHVHVCECMHLRCGTQPTECGLYMLQLSSLGCMNVRIFVRKIVSSACPYQQTWIARRSNTITVGAMSCPTSLLKARLVLEGPSLSRQSVDKAPLV